MKTVKEIFKTFLTEEENNLRPEETGLTRKIWIDCGNTFKLGGHASRIKIQNNEKGGMVPMIISKEPEIPNSIDKNEIKISSKEIKLIKKFIIDNYDLFKQLEKGKITFADFKEKMIKAE